AASWQYAKLDWQDTTPDNRHLCAPDGMRGSCRSTFSSPCTQPDRAARFAACAPQPDTTRRRERPPRRSHRLGRGAGGAAGRPPRLSTEWLRPCSTFPKRTIYASRSAAAQSCPALHPLPASHARVALLRAAIVVRSEV